MKRVLQWSRAMLLIACTLLLMMPLPSMGYPVASAASAAPPFVTLDEPSDGRTVHGGAVEISGTYAGVYDVRLYINGTRQVEVHMADPDGDDAGSWSYTLDASLYDGEVELVARGLDVSTRYGIWSGKTVLQVHNPSAAAPVVTIVSPEEGVSLDGTVQIEVEVASSTPVSLVQLRLNRGPWQTLAYDGARYVHTWNTAGIGDRTVSLEARATHAPGRYGYSPTVYAKVGAGTNEPFVLPKQDRAMWIWEPESYRLLLNPGSRTVLEGFAADTNTFDSEPVTTLYLAVGSYAGYRALEEQEEELKDFIRWAHERHLQVHALIAGGTSPPYMGAYERYHHHAVREMEQIVNYNLAAAPEERFDGINVDIEPYISPDFKDPSKFLQREYLDGLRKMIQRRDAAGIHLPFGPAIPKWYDTSEQGAEVLWNGEVKWLSEHIQDISDYISIMDYRDTADGSAGIIAGAEGEMAYAEAIGKPNSVVIGVETLDIANSGDPEVITFREEGRTHMEAELDKVYAAYSGSSAFGGIAVHHYDSYRLLPSYWGEGGAVWMPPADNEPPTAVQSGPSATAADFQTVNVSYGMAYDNLDIDRYIIYRSTEPGFAPTAAHIAGLSRSLSFQDKGLLPDTTYYYKVAARDWSGNIGPVSAEASATTGSTALQPLIVKEMNIGYAGTAGNAAATMRIADYRTGEALAGAVVEGRFTYSGGRYVSGISGAGGVVAFGSEAVAANRQIGFEPRRITLAGYYYASAHDEPHTTALFPHAGLDGLTTDAGTWNAPFAPGRTAYTVTVHASVQELRLVPVAAQGSSVIRINGVEAASGVLSAPVSIGSGPSVVSVVVYNADGTADVYLLRIERSGGQQLTELVSADAYVHEHFPANNYGAAPVLEIADIPNASGGGDRIAYMRAELGAIADPVVSARLYFYVPEAPSRPVSLALKGYAGAVWEENALNWQNRPVAGGMALGTVQVTGAGWYSIDVAPLVAAHAASGGALTFQWNEPNTAGVVIRMNSRESDVGKPYLLVNT